MNPLTVLDDVLKDWASPRARRLIHALIVLAAIIVTAWLAADGDWGDAAVSLLAAIYAGANHANTSSEEPPDDGGV